MTEQRHYMACLDLRGRRCLVVGGGRVGLEKARGLLDCGAAVTAVSPALEHLKATDPERVRRIEGLVPLGRLGDPTQDIGPPSVFLCSDDARYITGQTLVVSGGRFTGL